MTSLVSASQVVTGQVQSLDSVRAHALPSDAMIFASATKVQPANQNPGSYGLVESANALTLTTTGSVPVVTQSPFADLYKEGSLYFNGTTGNYVSATATGLAGTQWNTTGLTVEAWVNYPTFTGASVAYTLGLIEPTLVGLMSATGSGASSPFSNVSFGVNTTGNVLFWYNTTAVGQYTVTSYTQLSTNTWNHIAVSIAPAGFVYLFVNGVQSQIQENRNGTAIGAYYYGVVQGTPSVTSTNPLVIGQFNQVAGTVYVADLRITTGAGIYTGSASSYATFTVPSAPLSPYTTGGAVGQALIRAGQNSPTIQSGALTFDRGLKSFMNFGPMTFNIVTQGFTAVWRGQLIGTPSSFESIFEGGVTNSTNGWFALIRSGTSSSFYFTISASSSTSGGGSTGVFTLNQGTQYVVTVRYNPVTQIIDAWVNGVQQSSVSCLTSALVADRSIPLYVCTNGTGSFTSMTSNTLAIYNRALSNVEILNAYSALTTNTVNAPIEIGDVNGTPALSIAGDGRVNVTKIGQSSNVLPWPPSALQGYVTSINGQTYVASASSEFSTPATGYPYAWYAFDKSATTYWVTNAPLYGSSAPYAYTGTVTTTDVNGTIYPGEWVQIQKPVSTVVSSYVITCNGIAAAPQNFVILGSRDGVNWFLVDSRSGVTWTSTGQSLTFSVQPTQAFSYYRAVTRNIQGNGTYVQFIEWTLYGTADTAQPLTVAQPVTLSYGAQTASLTGIAGSAFVPQDFSSSGLNIPAYITTSNASSASNVIVPSSFGPFTGQGSLYYPGGSAPPTLKLPYTTAPSLNFNPFTGDFTAEAWVYNTVATTYNTIVGNYPEDWAFKIVSDRTVQFYDYNTGAALGFNFTGGTVPLNTWTHVAVTYSSSITTARIFVNGTLSTSTSTYTGTPRFTSTQLEVGSFNNGSHLFNGYIGEVRIVRGAALYTTSFTPPTAPLQPIQGTTQAGLPYGTVLLLRNAPAPGRVLTSKFGGANSGQVLAFPPSAMTSYSTLLNSGYGQGTYVASASSEATAAWYAFDKTVGSGSTGYWSSAGSTYNTSTGYVATTVTTVDVNGTSYAGEWLQAQMPSSIVLSTYSLQARGDSYTQTPLNFWVLGSRDGVNWSLVDSRTAVSWTATSQIQVFSLVSSQAFTFFRLVVNRVTAPQAVTSTSEWTLNGTIEGPNVTADGRLGLGVSNPVQALEVAGSAVVAGTLSAGNPLMFRNSIYNGAMAVNQRGISTNWASPTAMGTSAGGLNYSLDRMNHIRSALQSGGALAQGTLATTDAPFSQGLQYYLRVGRASGDTNTGFMEVAQMLESRESYKFAGQAVTFSFFYRTGSGFSGSGIVGSLLYGTGTDQNGVVSNFTNQGTLTSPTYSASNAWQRVSFTSFIPPTSSQVGMTISYTPSGTAGGFDYFDVTGVQLEKGTLATPYEVRPYAVELQLCQRYYEQSYEIGTAPGTTTNTGICVFSCSSDGNPRAYATVRYAVPKRSAVTPTFYTQTGTAGSWNYYQNGTSSTSALSIYGGSAMATTSFSVYQNVTTAWATCNVVGHWVANAEL